MDMDALNEAVSEQVAAEAASESGSPSSDYDTLLAASAEEETPTVEVKKEEKPAEKKEELKEEKKPETVKATGLVAKAGDKTIEIPEGATIKKIVEGKEVEISIAEAIRHHQFNVPYARKMEEAASAKKEAEASKQEVERLRSEVQRHARIVADGLQEAQKTLAADNIDAWLHKTAQTQQIPVAALAAKLQQYYLPRIQRYLSSDEHERKALDLEDKTRYYETELEGLKARDAANARLSQFKQTAVQMQQQHGLSDEDCQKADIELRREYGNIPPVEQMTPQQFQQYVEAVVIRASTTKTESGISGLISSVAPELKEEDPEQFSTLAETLRGLYQQYDPADLEDVIRQALGKKAKAKGADEDEAVILADQPEKARHKPAESRNDEDDEDDEFVDLRKQVEDDPLSVYGR